MNPAETGFSAEKARYALTERADGGNQWTYEISPALALSDAKPIASELFDAFPQAFERYGFIAKTALRPDNSVEYFVDFGIEKSVSEDEQARVLNWIRSRLASLH